jgi:hypothetical protein
MSIPLTVALTGATCPIPIIPGTPTLGNGATGPFASGMQTQNTSALLDQYSYAIINIIGQQGCGGYGVLTGLQVSVASGLNIAVSAGIAQLNTVTEFLNSGSPFGPQVLLMSTYTMADNATNYVWITSSGGITSNTTVGSPPTNALILLAIVTCSSGAITVIDYSNRPYLSGGILTKYTGDRSGPTDVPPQGWVGYTVTLAGTYFFNGHSYTIAPSISSSLTYSATISAPLQLIAQDHLTAFELTASASSETVLLPNPTTLFANWKCQITNVGASNSIVIKDYTNTMTYTTLSPGYSVNPYVSNGTGTLAFPSGSWPSAVFPTPSPGPL